MNTDNIFALLAAINPCLLYTSKGFCYEDETDRFVCRQGEYLAFQKLIYKKSTQNYYRLYSRSKNNVKTARIFQPVPQISVQSESMRVLIIPLFIEIAKK